MDLGYTIVAIVGYGLSLLAILYAIFSIRDAARLLKAGADIDEDGLGRNQYYLLTLGLLVTAAVIAMVTRWILGSF